MSTIARRFPIVKFVNDVIPWIEEKILGILIISIFNEVILFPEKAREPIVVTLFGIVTFVF